MKISAAFILAACFLGAVSAVKDFYDDPSGLRVYRNGAVLDTVTGTYLGRAQAQAVYEEMIEAQRARDIAAYEDDLRLNRAEQRARAEPKSKKTNSRRTRYEKKNEASGNPGRLASQSKKAKKPAGADLRGGYNTPSGTSSVLQTRTNKKNKIVTLKNAGIAAVMAGAAYLSLNPDKVDAGLKAVGLREKTPPAPVSAATPATPTTSVTPGTPTTPATPASDATPSTPATPEAAAAATDAKVTEDSQASANQTQTDTTPTTGNNNGTVTLSVEMQPSETAK